MSYVNVVLCCVNSLSIRLSCTHFQGSSVPHLGSMTCLDCVLPSYIAGLDQWAFLDYSSLKNMSVPTTASSPPPGSLLLSSAPVQANSDIEDPASGVLSARPQTPIHNPKYYMNDELSIFIVNAVLLHVYRIHTTLIPATSRLKTSFSKCIVTS